MLPVNVEKRPSVQNFSKGVIYKDDVVIPKELQDPPPINKEGVEDEKNRRRRRRNLLKKRKNYYERLEKKRKDINERMLKILERVELDRHILLKEKFVVLWNMEGASAETDFIQNELNK